MESKRFSYTAFLVLSFFCLSSFAEPIYIGRIKTIDGNVTIQESDKKFTAKLYDKLYEGYVIETHSNSHIGLRFIDGTKLSIGPDSQVIINRYLFSPKEKSYAFDVMLTTGSAIYSSGKLGKLSPDSIKVQTPEATIGVRGTKFLVEVD